MFKYQQQQQRRAELPEFLIQKEAADGSTMNERGRTLTRRPSSQREPCPAPVMRRRESKSLPNLLNGRAMADMALHAVHAQAHFAHHTEEALMESIPSQ
jgi:hypothetical protein